MAVKVYLLEFLVQLHHAFILITRNAIEIDVLVQYSIMMEKQKFD